MKSANIILNKYLSGHLIDNSIFTINKESFYCKCENKILAVDDNEFNIMVIKGMMGQVKINMHSFF